MKNIFFLFCLFVSTLLCFSCNNNLYTPSEANLLMLSEEGDLKASVGVGITTVREANVNVQAAYSPMEHLGIAMNYFQIGGFSNPKTNEASGTSDISNIVGELAVGYYLKKDINAIKYQGTDIETPVQNQLVLDAYAGYGFGNVRKAYNTGYISFNSQHYFIQGGAHFRTKLLGLSYALRGVLLDYTKGSIEGRLSDADLSAVNTLRQDPLTFLESSFRIQAGGDKAKFFFSRNWMMAPLNKQRLDYNSSSWQIGAIFDLNTFFKKKESGGDLKDI